MNSNIQIRIITPEDAKRVNELSKQLGYTLSDEETLTNINEIINLKAHITLVAVDDEKIVGWIHAFETRTIESLPFIELAGLVVDENYRGKGVGKILVEKIKQWCVEKNILSLRVRSNIKRKEAHQFYLNLGFKEMKEQKVFQMNL